MQDHKQVHPLRLERLKRSWTQQELADFAQVSLSSVERAEQGRPLRVDICRRLCDCLGKTKPQELGLRCHGMLEENRNDGDVPQEAETILGVTIMSLDALRRRLLEYVLATGGVAAALSIQDILDLEPWERLSYLRDIDEETIVKFEKITANCWQLLKFDGLAAAEQLLPTYLPQIAAFARQSSKYQSISCSARSTINS
ncbi:MAG: helix-turn-helix transcriptional regulator [Ktedonobacteraceae bacterium]|nr:helix-turn-helix transcriptional regulator [Ktedonobacteraceae bacterium]